MRAVVVTAHGGPEVLRATRVPMPVPAPGEVVVAVTHAAVNYVDVLYRAGRLPVQLPFVPGREGAGVVTAVGHGVTERAVGDRVAWAMQGQGSYAEAVALPASRTVPVPAPLDDAVAAGALTLGITATVLRDAVPVGPSSSALVHSGGGGVGHVLIQLLTAAGATVLATASTADKAALARRAGAVAVVDSRSPDLPAAVRAVAPAVDVVYDAVGAPTFAANLGVLAVGGRLVLYGEAGGRVPPVDPMVLLEHGSLGLIRLSALDFIASDDGLHRYAAEVLDQAAVGTLVPHIGETFPLTAASAAHEALQRRESVGRLLLAP